MVKENEGKEDYLSTRLVGFGRRRDHCEWILPSAQTSVVGVNMSLVCNEKLRVLGPHQCSLRESGIRIGIGMRLVLR